MISQRTIRVQGPFLTFGETEVNREFSIRASCITDVCDHEYGCVVNARYVSGDSDELILGFSREDVVGALADADAGRHHLLTLDYGDVSLA